MTIPTMIQTQLNHRTIREFKDKEVPKEIVDLLFEVANRTATSSNMQSFSMIYVTDQAIKDEISLISTQDYPRRSPMFVVFVVDTQRNDQIIREEGLSLSATADMDRFFQGTIDSALAAQNMVNAAEALGLGTCYFGSILNDSKRLIELLKLPKLTMPILGLGIGYPNQEPKLKPRIPLKNKVFENHYPQQVHYKEELKPYDLALIDYYNQRNSGSHKRFADYVIEKYSHVNIKRAAILKVIKNQGYNV
jgi:nitroreductase